MHLKSLSLVSFSEINKSVRGQKCDKLMKINPNPKIFLKRTNFNRSNDEPITSKVNTNKTENRQLKC